MEINIGGDKLGSLGAKGQVASRDAAWTNAIGSIIAKQLHDYDNGKSFGLGVTLNRKVDAKGMHHGV